jgi:HupE / UreJ protein
MSRAWPAWFSIVMTLVTLTLAGQARAHVRSESHSVWEVGGDTVDLVMTLPKIETQRLGVNGDQPSDDVVKAYLAARVYPLASGQRCALAPPVETLSASPEFRRFDFTFKCPSEKDLQVHSAAFFDVVPSHTNFAQIQNSGTGEFAEQLITRDHQTVQVTGGEEHKLQTANFFEFVLMGLMHIFTGVDHMSFLLGLVLISRKLRDLIFVVTGFTIGHSLTLGLAVTGVIRPHAEYIDALVALTIALIGAENLAVSTRRPIFFAAGLGGLMLLMAVARMLGIGELPPLLLLGGGLFAANYLLISGQLPDAGRLRMVITLVFGLIHGFGFAAGLLELQIPPGRLAELLVGFNLGVEAGQLTLVLTAVGAVVILSRLKLALPRAITVDMASSLLVGLGLFWFVTRSYA